MAFFERLLQVLRLRGWNQHQTHPMQYQDSTQYTYKNISACSFSYITSPVALFPIYRKFLHQPSAYEKISQLNLYRSMIKKWQRSMHPRKLLFHL